MAKKSWSYKEVTTHSENQIRDFMESSIRQNTDRKQLQHRSWAWGVYLSWFRLTYGQQVEGDNERLENLTKIENYQGK